MVKTEGREELIESPGALPLTFIQTASLLLIIENVNSIKLELFLLL